MAPRKRQRVNYFDDPVLLGRRLRETRERAGLSQRELSFPGCTAAYISRIEKGERVPSLQLIREFSARLGVTEEFISHGSHAPKQPRSNFVEGRVAVRTGEFDVARQLADAMLDAARSDADRARASALFGEIALHSGDADAAVDALERASRLDPAFEELDPDFAETLGRAYVRGLQYELAIAVFLRNRDRAADEGDVLNEVRFSSLLASAYADSGNPSDAEEALAQALKLSDGVGDALQRAKALWAQSRLHALHNDSGAAARYAERALEILQVSDYMLHVGYAHLLLAHIETDRGNSDRALALLERGEVPIVTSGRRFEFALSRIEYARALAQSGRAKEAVVAAVAASGALGDVQGIDAGRGYLLIADVFESVGDEERALELYELAIEKLETLPSRYTADAYAKFAALLEKRGDKDAALEVLKRAVHVQQVDASTETRSRP